MCSKEYKQTILFLTSNDNTEDLYKWLLDKCYKVIKYTEKLTPKIFGKYMPDITISFNYKHIIDEDVIFFGGGRNYIVNLHISYLPYNRGWGPNFFSFYDNSPKGVTIHMIDEGIDTGDILVQKEVMLDENIETFISSYDKLLMEIQELFKDNWDLISQQTLQPKPQIDKGSFHTLKELNLIREQYHFEWNENISDVKKRVFV